MAGVCSIGNPPLGVKRIPTVANQFFAVMAGLPKRHERTLRSRPPNNHHNQFGVRELVRHPSTQEYGRRVARPPPASLLHNLDRWRISPHISRSANLIQDYQPASLFRLPQDTPRRALAGSLFISGSGSIPVSAQAWRACGRPWQIQRKYRW